MLSSSAGGATYVYIARTPKASQPPHLTGPGVSALAFSAIFYGAEKSGTTGSAPSWGCSRWTEGSDPIAFGKSREDVMNPKSEDPISPEG